MASGPTPSRPPLVLVASDHEWSSRSFESILSPEGFAVLHAHTGQQALALVRSVQPDAVLVSLQLPDMAGLDVCRQFRAESLLSPATPLLVTTSGQLGRAERLEALRAGAWELIVQPADAEVFLLKLRNYVRARFECESLHDASLLDQLTGLYNARGLARRAREIGAEALRRHDPLACVAIAPETEMTEAADLQLVDVVASHLATHLGEFLRDHGRLSDAIGRVGRTEFAIVAPATETNGAIRMVERIESSMATRPLTIDGRERSVKLRVGYAAVPDLADASIDAVELLLRATAALRQARTQAAPLGTRISMPTAGGEYLH